MSWKFHNYFSKLKANLKQGKHFFGHFNSSTELNKFHQNKKKKFQPINFKNPNSSLPIKRKNLELKEFFKPAKNKRNSLNGNIIVIIVISYRSYISLYY